MSNPLLISEIIPKTIQGEGPFTGNPSFFLRTAVCNLDCTFCDTRFSWDRNKKNDWRKIFILDELLSFMDTEKSAQMDCVFTGGEPLLWRKNNIFKDSIELALSLFNRVVIETNGTMYYPFTKQQSTWISCSPKLSNSNVPKERRYKRDVLEAISYRENSYFKFVVSSQKDIDEIHSDFDFIDPNKIWLMACAETKEELDLNEPQVVDWCIRYGYRFSTRLHLRLGVS